MTTETYELYALRYAHLETSRSHTFLGGVAQDGPLAMDYYVWVARSESRTVLIDTGFGEATARRRGRQWERCPIDSLSMLGIQPDEIRDVVVTHLHYDHAGNLNKLPAATLHLQQREMAFATSRYMCIRHISLGGIFEAEDVCSVVRSNFDGRVHFLDGDDEIAPGIHAHLVGGHTPGMQMVRVQTARGPVVLMSDAAHLYENIEKQLPFHIAHDVADMVSGWRKALLLGGASDRVVPGHDPRVLDVYPAWNGDRSSGIAVLHEPPRSDPLQTMDRLLAQLPPLG